MFRSNKGIGAVVVLLSILVVTVFGFTGYYVWNTQQDKKDETTQTTNTGNQNNNSETTKNIENTNTDTSSIDETYFLIPELGVKLVLEDDIKDLIYESQGDNAVNLSSQELLNLDSSCTALSGPLGALMKQNGEYKTSEPRGDLVKQFDGYFIVITPQQGCGTDNVTDVFLKKSEALEKSLPSLTQI